MKDEWRERLKAEIEKKIAADPAVSWRSISLGAGLGHQYLSELFNPRQKKNPKLDEILRIIDAAGISAARVLAGVDVSPEVEGILADIADLDEESREAIKTLIAGRAR